MSSANPHGPLAIGGSTILTQPSQPMLATTTKNPTASHAGKVDTLTIMELQNVRFVKVGNINKMKKNGDAKYVLLVGI